MKKMQMYNDVCIQILGDSIRDQTISSNVEGHLYNPLSSGHKTSPGPKKAMQFNSQNCQVQMYRINRLDK